MFPVLQALCPREQTKATQIVLVTRAYNDFGWCFEKTRTTQNLFENHTNNTTPFPGVLGGRTQHLGGG